jgi:hypothetical protein
VIAEAISRITDFLPYGIGRAVVAIVSLRRWRCEPWSLLFWTVDSLNFSRPPAHGRPPALQAAGRTVCRLDGSALLEPLNRAER